MLIVMLLKYAYVLRVSSGECVEWEQRLLEEVKAVCKYTNNDWYRVYLLRTLNRQEGTDCVQAVMNSTPYEWVFPAELLQLQVSVVQCGAFQLLRIAYESVTLTFCMFPV